MSTPNSTKLIRKIKKKQLKSTTKSIIIKRETKFSKGTILDNMKKFITKHTVHLLYLFFGGLTTAINIATFSILRYFQTPTSIANIIAWIISVLFAYITNRKWVFKSQTKGSEQKKEFLKFISARIFTGILDEILIILLVDIIKNPIPTISNILWETTAKITTNVIVIILNYVLSQKIIFKQKDASD